MHIAARITRLVCLGFVIPTVLSLVVYFGFVTNYTGGLFSKEHVREQYEAGIYRYRILGRVTLLRLNEILENAPLPAFAPRAVFFIDRQASLVLYTAYFLHNTFFLCLACVVLTRLFEKLAPPGSVWIGDLSVLFLTLLMTITQYVIVPYDTLTYLLMALAVSLIFSEPKRGTLVLLGVVVVLATLTRETSALLLSFYFALHHRRLLARPLRWSPQHKTLTFLVATFLLTYVGLRLVLGAEEKALFEDVQLMENLTGPLALAGLLFALAVTAVLALNEPARREGLVFLLASSPYLLVIVATARLWEIRLWVPVFLLLVILKVWRMGADDQKTKMI